MEQAGRWISCFAISVLMLIPVSAAAAQDTSTFVVELEAGPVWQSRNDVQIPNEASGTWNINRRHGLRALLAPLSYGETGSFVEPVDFAGATYEPGAPVEGTYKFNSWRLSYRYRFMDRESVKLTIGLTVKIRDAKIELRQGGTSSKDTDVGFVPLLHLAADWQFARQWHLHFDFDGLAGGPGRAFDAALKLGYDFNEHVAITGGYRTLEGGADVESVYNFAWFHYAVVSVVFRF
jgi:hypothetical protein